MRARCHTIVLALCLLLSGVCLRGQNARFDEARSLFAAGKTLAAARAFHALAEEAEDENLRLRSLLAEGECYYALDLISDLEKVRDEVNNALREQDILGRNDLDSASLVLREAFFKLSGSYSILSRSYGEAESCFDQAEADLRRLRDISLFDSVKAELTLLRERVSLYYLRKNYKQACRYSQACLDSLLDSGFGPDGQPTDDFAEAVSAHALVLCRLGRFDEAEEILSYVPDWKRFPAYLRRLGQMALLRHDAVAEEVSGDAPDAYRSYRDYLLQDIEQRMAGMTETEREQYWLSLQPFLLDAYRLGAAAPELLYDLALLSKGYLITFARDRRRTDWRQVQGALQEGECAIEFIEYAGKGDARRMAALVLGKHDAAPKYVDLYDVGRFLNEPLPSGLTTVRNALFVEEEGHKNMLYGDPVDPQKMPRKIWTPALMAAIGDAQRIFFAPDGFIHALAIEYLLPESMNERQVVRLSSTRVLTDRDRGVKPAGRALLVGGVDYAAAIHPKRKGNDRLAYEDFRSKEPFPNVTNSLKGTLLEVENLLSVRSNRKDRIVTGAAATDEALMDLLPGGWDIVHVATHGFCRGAWFTTELKPVAADPVMSSSGIKLAGLQTAVNDPAFDYDYNDGCLSARELGRLDFSGVGLVVLSACQTGLGYASSEGVYGLQRGLKMAGARGLVLSLWEVDDSGTCEMMRRFYLAMKEGASVKTAFEQSRRSMITDDYDPYIYDAFILIDCF